LKLCARGLIYSLMRNFKFSVGFIFVIMFAGGCAGKPPEAISKIPADNPSLSSVRMNLDQYMGAEVRWGGEIAKVENRVDRTWIEVVRRQLWVDGKPKTSGKSDGRFIASFTGFVDPVVYEVGQPLTVVGTIEDKIKRPIGDYDYVFPIVTVEGSYLWQATTGVQNPNYPPHWWYYDLRYRYPGPYYRHPRYYR
jgi:outer membrane lipoprotein